MDNKLDFSTNWNGKLHTTIFHTLRRSGRFSVGDRVEATLNGSLLGVVECINKTRYDDIRHVPDTICYLDTGYNQAETENILAQMYKDDPTGKPIYGYLFKFLQSTSHRKNLKRTVQLAMELPLAT